MVRLTARESWPMGVIALIAAVLRVDGEINVAGVHAGSPAVPESEMAGVAGEGIPATAEDTV